MATTRAKKQEILNELMDKLPKATSIVFVKNSGVTMESLTSLRKKLKEGNTEVKVAKKTLVKKVFVENKMPELSDEVLDGPIIMAIGYDDPVFGAKTLKTFMKNNDKMAFSGAFFEGNIFDKKGIERIASLPSKEELIAQLLRQMQAPLYGLHYALSYHLRGLVVALSAIAKKKQEQTA